MLDLAHRHRNGRRSDSAEIRGLAPAEPASTSANRPPSWRGQSRPLAAVPVSPLVEKTKGAAHAEAGISISTAM
jgi:hypothetical protein